MRRAGARRGRGERGFVAATMGIALVALVGVIGFSVDVGHWYLSANRLQSAADAAALGGVVFLPGDMASARTVAAQIAREHGLDPSNVVVSPGDRPNQLRVTISEDVDNFFTPVVGVDSTKVARTAVAEYVRPLQMGSPNGTLGNDPDLVGTTGYTSPDYWLSVAGPKSQKINGDRYLANGCDTVDDTRPSLCKQTSTGAWVNAETDSDGYFFTVDVTSSVGGLRIEAFDPVWAPTGATCLNAIFPGDDEIDALVASNPSRFPAATTRARYDYGTEDGGDPNAAAKMRYCSGDDALDGGGMKTTFTIRMPDQTAWSNTDNPIIRTSACKPRTYNAYDIPQRVNNGKYSPTGAKTIIDWLNRDSGFVDGFHRWVTLCDISAGSLTPGKYIVQVQTNGNANGAGANRFSLRVGGIPAGSGPGVVANSTTVTGSGRLPIFANRVGSNTTFYLSRILADARGRKVEVSLYDVGDAIGQQGTIKILSPTGSNMPAGGLRDCSFERSDGPKLTDVGGCTITNVSAETGYNGRLVYIEIPIPDDYNCDPTDPTACWLKVRVSFPTGVTDFTTWSSSLGGDPVRLIE